MPAGGNTMGSEKIKVAYLGKKEISLNLFYLEEKNIKFTPGGFAWMKKQDAAKLIKENPKTFKVIMEQYQPEEDEAEDNAKMKEPREAGADDIRALLDAMPNKRAICDYCEEEYGLKLDHTVKKELLLDEAVQGIQDLTGIG